MAGYIGQAPANKFLTLDKQTFTTSATDTYSLDKTVSSANEIELFLNNVRQEPIEAYTVSGSTLTLASAITSSDTMYCIYQGKAIGTVSPATNSVSNDMLVNSSVTVNGTSISLGGSETITAGKIGQVVQTFKNDNFSTTSSTFVDVNDMSVSITPSATSSKILVGLFSYGTLSVGNNQIFSVRLLRDSTVIANNFVNDNFHTTYSASNIDASPIYTNFLDSPSTTSSVTYKMQVKTSGDTLHINRLGGASAYSVSTITLMEVLA